MILLRMEKAPPIITFPSLDSRETPALPNIRQEEVSSSTVTYTIGSPKTRSPVNTSDISMTVDSDEKKGHPYQG